MQPYAWNLIFLGLLLIFFILSSGNNTVNCDAPTLVTFAKCHAILQQNFTQKAES